MKIRAHAKGLLITALVIFVIGTGLAVYKIYGDISKMEEGIFNLKYELRSAKNYLAMMDEANKIDEDSAQKVRNFSEATKNWQIEQNNDFNYQFKRPNSWGDVIVLLEKKTEDKSAKTGRRLSYGFTHLGDAKLFFDVITKDYQSADPEEVFANQNIGGLLNKNKVGECGNELFDELKKLGIGEIRNCLVKENILNQKYLVYRHVQSAGQEIKSNQQVAIYPNAEYYILLKLPDEIDTDIEYFLQSLVFLN